MALKPAEGFSVEPRSITGNQDNGYSDTHALWGKTGGGKYTVGGTRQCVDREVWARVV